MTAWLEHVKKTFKELKTKNPATSLKDALKHASKTYKKSKKHFTHPKKGHKVQNP